MLAGAHYWTTNVFRAAQRDYEDALRCIAARERAEHRKLPREKRILKDLLAVTDKLARAAATTPRQAERIGTDLFLRRTERWMKQYHRLNRMLNN